MWNYGGLPGADYHGAGKRSGKPCIRGLRITVYDILEYLAGGMSHQEILADFPSLTEDDIMACPAFAADGDNGTLESEGARPKARNLRNSVLLSARLVKMVDSSFEASLPTRAMFTFRDEVSMSLTLELEPEVD